MGRKFIRGADDVSAGDYHAMTRAEKSMFRLGSSDGLEQILGNKGLGPTADFTREFFKPNTIEVLRTILPQGETVQRMNEIIRRESRMSGTAKEVLGNSKTQQRGMDDLELGRSMLEDAYTRFRSSGSMLNLGLDAVKHAAEKTFGFRDDLATALARKLFTANRAEQDRILQEVAKRYGKQRMGDFFRIVHGISLRGTTGAAGSAGDVIGESARNRNVR
jgi:hypothetical protein